MSTDQSEGKWTSVINIQPAKQYKFYNIDSIKKNFVETDKIGSKCYYVYFPKNSEPQLVQD